MTSTCWGLLEGGKQRTFHRVSTRPSPSHWLHSASAKSRRPRLARAVTAVGLPLGPGGGGRGQPVLTGARGQITVARRMGQGPPRETTAVTARASW